MEDKDKAKQIEQCRSCVHYDNKGKEETCTCFGYGYLLRWIDTFGCNGFKEDIEKKLISKGW